MGMLDMGGRLARDARVNPEPGPRVPVGCSSSPAAPGVCGVGGGGSVSGGIRCPADRMTMHGHRPVTVGNADRRARNFEQVGSAVHTSCPTRARGCISLTVPGNPRAVRVQNYQRLFLAVLATRGRENEFHCRKKCGQQLRRCPITQEHRHTLTPASRFGWPASGPGP